jgi:hypothetical protein
MVLDWKGWGILSGIIAVAAYVVGLAVSIPRLAVG